MLFMSNQEDWIYIARKSLIDDVLDIIRENKDFSSLKTKVYYGLCKLGVNITAQKEGLLSEKLWARKENKDNIMKLMKSFLWKHIK